MFSKNVELKPYSPPPAWRKIAQGQWRNCGDPSVYGLIDIDARGLLKTIEDFKEKGIHITPTAIMAKAVSVCINAYPIVNGIIRFGRFYQRKNIDIFLQVGVGGNDVREENLSGIVIRCCDKKSLSDIAAEIKEKATPIKKGNDREYKKIKGFMRKVPGALIRPFINIISFFLYGLNIWTPLLSTPKDPFGSAMVTSVGMLGVEKGLAPLIPYARTTMLIAVGKIHDKAVVEDGEVKVRPVIPLGITLDHRYIDGVGGAKMLNALKEYLKAPY